MAITDEMVSLILSNLFGNALKTNDSDLQFAVFDRVSPRFQRKVFLQG